MRCRGDVPEVEGAVSAGQGIGGRQALRFAQHQRDGVGYLATLPRPADVMPDWVQGHNQTTDGYICAVAASHGLKLATFDTGIDDRSVELIA